MSVVITDDILSAAGISSDELKLEIAIVLFDKYWHQRRESASPSGDDIN